MEPLGLPSAEDQEATYQRAKDAALRFLAYRPRSEAEVRRRLLRRYSDDTVERVIRALKEQRYLDDPAFALQWRNNREQHRPRAQRLLRQELLRLGVSSEVANTALDGFDNEASAYRAGSRLAQKLTSRDYSEEELRRRLWSHLRQRGFSYGEVKETVDRLWADLLHRKDDAEDDEQ